MRSLGAVWCRPHFLGVIKMWSFEIRWPAPFARDWKQSSRTFEEAEGAAFALAQFLEISAVNGQLLEGRLVPMVP